MPDTSPPTRRIAMWSGPRNLSSALMRSFSSRADCAVRDEPFYAAYLAATGRAHPMAAETIVAGETDPARVAHACATEERGVPVLYQKHMTHHMLPGMDLGWTAALTNAFLIRAPEAVLASYSVKHEAADQQDIGFEKQAELFEREADRLGRAPVVVEAEDILRDPAAMLPALCAALDIPWDPAMLSWEVGPHPDDGAWAPHWYGSLWASTGFAPWTERAQPALGAPEARLAEEARPFYERLHAHRIRP
ncbi:HAD family hydrolase [Oceanicella sp. SM1341]|uniref:sulfotransferase-like domain-containing protein n=1 Tax=Oceanicella sp. SM1341 TaxID=1548889 RepID=UPI001E36E1EA|nr:HAD family hydrolase [Oceanicella sp. SM1341]